MRPKRTFVSAITLISIIGVMLGVAVLIIVISVMTGFDRQLRDRILGFNAHMRVMAGEPMGNYQEVMDLIAANDKVRGVAPYVIGQVMVRTQPVFGKSQVLAPIVRGIDPREERDVSGIATNVVEGRFEVRGDGVLVGAELARKLHLQVGDKLLIYSIADLEEMAESYQQGGGEAVLADEYDIEGIFDVGYYEFNDMFIITSLYNAQDLYGLGDAVEGLMVMLHDPDEAFEVRSEIGPVLGSNYFIKTWQEDNAGILDALIVEKNVMFYLLFFIMIVAAFGITSALITFVVQKTREIGMLKALGATGRQIMWIFLSQSVLVGIMGVLAGLGLGILGVHYRNAFLRVMRMATGQELFPSSIYGFTELPALIVPTDIMMIAGGSFVICILAGIIPAWNAGRLQPVEALRYE